MADPCTVPVHGNPEVDAIWGPLLDALTLDGQCHWWMTAAPDDAASVLVAFWSRQ